MIAYVDTSITVKKYLEEEGSDRVDIIFNEFLHLESSILIRLELAAFVERSKRERRINSGEYRNIVQLIKKDMGGWVALMAIDQNIIDQAEQLIKQHLLKAPDAIHLASALQIQKRTGKNLKFLSADNRLIEAAKLEGLVCINPLE